MKVSYIIRPKRDWNKSGKSPIYARVRSQQKYIVVAIDRYVEGKHWNQSLQGVKRGASAGYEGLNQFLREARLKAENALSDYILKHGVRPAKPEIQSILKDVFKGKKEIPFVIETLRSYVQENPKGYKAGTLKQYENLKNNFSDFQQKTGFKYSFTRFSLTDYEAFTEFLYSQKKHEDSTVSKLQKNLIALFRYAYQKGIHENKVFEQFKRVSVLSKDVIPLEFRELETLLYYPFPDGSPVAKARDIFCFLCLTGGRISDLKYLIESQYITETEAGRVWAFRTAKGKGENVRVPLLPEAETILDRNGGELPKLSEQKINKYLKQAAKQAGLNRAISKARNHKGKQTRQNVPLYERISTHFGRKTFTTLCSEAGVQEWLIKAFTGRSQGSGTIKFYRQTTDVSNWETLYEHWEKLKTKYRSKGI